VLEARGFRPIFLMTNSPNSGNERSQSSTRAILPLKRRQWRNFAIIASAILLTGIGAGASWVWIFVNSQLAPLVEQNLSKTLDRPIRVGKVQRFSLNGLRFGATKLPPTATDPDKVEVEAIEVAFNPIPFLLNRTLPLDVTLINPKVYIEQDQEGEWVSTRIKSFPKGQSDIEIKLEILRVKNADVVLLPRGGSGNERAPIFASLPSGTSRFFNDNKLIRFDGEGTLLQGTEQQKVPGNATPKSEPPQPPLQRGALPVPNPNTPLGNFSITGESTPATGDINLAVSGKNLSATEIGRLIQLPILLQAGKVNGNMDIQLKPKQPLQLFGTASLENVTALITALPQPLAKTNGQLRFKGTQVQLEQVSTLFGEVPVQANGTLDTQRNYNLAAQTSPVAVEKVFNAFKFPKLPIPVSTEVQASLTITGPLNQPVVTGEAKTTKVTQIDRLNFNSVGANFKLVDSNLAISNVRATPTVGGLVTGLGEVKLGEKGSWVFDVQTANVPGEAIAKTYQLNLPFPIGSVSANARIAGPIDNAQNFRALGTANLQVAGGTVTATNVQVANGNFTAKVETSAIPLENLAQVPPQLKGPVSGKFELSGSLNNLTLDKITGIGTGSLKLASGIVNATNIELANGGFAAQLKTSGIPLESLAEVPAELRGPVSGDFNVAGSLTDLTADKFRGSGSGSLNVAGGTLTATKVELADGQFKAQVQASGVEVERLAKVPPEFRGPVSGNFNLAGPLTDLTLAKITGSGSGSLNVAGGTVNATNVQLAEGRFRAQVQASGVRVERLVTVPEAFGGPVSGNFNIAGSLTDFNPAKITGSGTGSINLAAGTINATNVQIADGRFSAQLQTSAVQVERLAEVPSQLRNPVAGNFNIAGSLTDFSPSTITGSGSGSFNLGGGIVNATNVQLADGRFRAQIQASGVQVESLATVPPQFKGPVSGNFNLAGSLTDLSPAKVTGSGSGSLNVAGGTVNATNVQLADGRFSAQVQASGVRVERLAEVPSQFQGPVSGNFNIAGSLTDFSPAKITGNGSGSLNVAGGTVNATNIQLADGRFSAVVEPSGVKLAGFSPELRGSLAGKLNVSGSLDKPTPAAIQAQGELNFSEGLALIDRPLKAAISWNGQQLQIQQATATGFNASGVVDVNLAKSGLEAIQAFNLNVRADDLNLQQLPAALPNNVKLAGRADFNGRIAGTPTAPGVNGELRLRDFVANNLKFEPLLAGTVNATPEQGVSLQLAGTNDKIQVALTPNYQPTSFLVQRGDTIAQGKRQGEELLVEAQNFPIALVKELAPLPTNLASQPLGGNFSGKLAVNLTNYGIAVEFAIANPILGSLRGDSFTGTVQSANGAITLNDGKFKQGNNEYALTGNITQTPKGPQFQANLNIAQGELKEILTALQIFNISDLSRGFNTPVFGKASEISVIPVGKADDSLQTQLQRLAEIKALEQQRESLEAASPIPPLAKAKGKFKGSVSVAGSLASGINAKFDIEGENWEWGPYSSKKVIAQGSFKDGAISFIPLRFQSDDSVATFSGTIGGEAQSGQLQLVNIPIAQLQEVMKLPPTVGFTGLLNGSALLSGTIENPQTKGEITLTDATLNQTKVQQAQGTFSYNNARLKFDSSLMVAQADPISIDGSVPFKLPIAAVAPIDNKFSVNINVQNQGLALMSVLSKGQVNWLDGKGNVKLNVSGNYDQEKNKLSEVIADGSASLENSTIQSSLLPQEPLKNVNGKVIFDFDRIQVQELQGQLSGGILKAEGILPISVPTPQKNPLIVNIGELAINLKGLYSGRVKGKVAVTGTALEPKIGGNVDLSNGQVFLEDRTAATDASGTGTASDGDATSPIQFKDLDIKLGKGVQIVKSPILDFLAQGTLKINGPLDNLQPKGEIRLERGQVNLFTTQFRLARGYDNKATFIVGRGLDPELDVRLQASVAEATQRRLPNNPLSSEISDVPTSSLGTVQTVRIQAKAQGPASQLADNLELTSTPSRSKAEIVSLLGGSFVDTLGRGDTTLGLANLAGSALLGNVQNIIGDALGLSEFRLFPRTLSNDKQRTSTFGLGAEVGVDLGRNLSVSVLKILTTDEPFEYSLRYRLNDNMLLRGSTDLSGSNNAILEYEKRF